MKKDIVIKYLPNTTTQDELKVLRQEFKEKDTTLILIISGKERLMSNLQNLINID
jgi:hypothetical protein